MTTERTASTVTARSAAAPSPLSRWPCSKGSPQSSASSSRTSSGAAPRPTASLPRTASSSCRCRLARATVLPPFARARAERRLGSEPRPTRPCSRWWPCRCSSSRRSARRRRDALTGFGARPATAAGVLPWLVAAGIASCSRVSRQARSRRSTTTRPLRGFAVGSVVGLVLIVWRVGDDGIDAVAWGMALNAGIRVLVPALRSCSRREAMPSGRGQPGPAIGEPTLRRARARRRPAAGAAGRLPHLPAVRRGRGRRRGDEPRLRLPRHVGGHLGHRLGAGARDLRAAHARRARRARVARHVDSSAWIAFVAVGATAGVFAVAGARSARRARRRLRQRRRRGAREVRRALTPWMLVTVGISATFPLVFVAAGAGGYRCSLVAVVVLHCLSRGSGKSSPASTACEWRSRSRPGVWSRCSACSGSAVRELAGLASRRRPSACSRWAPSSAAGLLYPPCRPPSAGSRSSQGCSRCPDRGPRAAWRYMRTLA